MDQRSSSPPNKSRTPRPTNVTMPSPTYSRHPGGVPANMGSPRDRVTPNSERGNSPVTSPVGPLSPSSTMSSNAFIFPIRSVFQNKGSGMSTSESQQSMGESGNPLSRVPSSRTPAVDSSSERRFSQSFMSSPPPDDDAGIQTIQQLLEQSSVAQQDKKPTGQASSATFRGRPDRERATKDAAEGSTPPRQVKPNSAGPHPSEPSPHGGFFSMPIMGKEGQDSPFFAGDSRRASDSNTDPSSSSNAKNSQVRKPPQLPKHDSGDSMTVHGGSIKNDSTTGTGSGLPDTSRPPIGQPQRMPEKPNFQDRPGPSKSSDPSRPNFSSVNFSTAKMTTRRRDLSPHAQSEDPQSNQQVRESSQATLAQPQPRSVGKGGMPGLTGSTASSSHRGSTAAFELDEHGERNLINDFSGIVRLGGAGSLSSNAGTNFGANSGLGTGSRSRLSGVSGTGLSMPATSQKLAQQDRQQAQNVRASQTRDTVRNFVEQQSHTENLADPNAPTPSPAPETSSEDSDPAPPLGERKPSSRGLGISTALSHSASGHEWGHSSDSSLSGPESSEVATASGDEEESSEPESEEPIVTFRFEHSHTADGHHVVVGREGKLRRCEDEPITTPGAVQGFGVLMVLEEDYDTGNLMVRQVSENATELLGLSPKYLFRLDCFSRVLTGDQEDLLRDNIEYLPDGETGKTSLEEEGPQVFLLSGYGEPGSDEAEDDEDETEGGSSRRREWTCWVAAHRPIQPTPDKVDEQGRPLAQPDLIVLEFELEKDIYNPLMQTADLFPPSFSSSAHSGGGTPDSASQTTLSGGSAPAGSTSYMSADSGGGDSAGSLTTIGSTPRPADTSATSDTTTQPATGSSVATYSNSRPSTKPVQGPRPPGLEGLEMDTPLARILESTTNHAKPLRALERMRRSGAHGGGDSEFGGSNSGSGPSRRGRPNRRNARRTPGGGTGTMDVFAVLGQINDQLGAATDLDNFLKIAVGVVQDLCRFHRVLIYQFDENYNGQVVAELVEWGKTSDLFKGLMFPAADIPAQARQLYKINKVRLLYDRSQTTARMVLRSKDDLDYPLDMTHCYLRAMSPIHIKYLANMGVRSSMSVSIMAFGQLWGLIACHSYGNSGMRVSFPVRQMMRLMSDSISKNIERLSYAQRLHTRKLISTIPTTHHPTGYIVSNADDLLQIFDAESGLLVIGDGCKLLGNNEQGQAMLAIAEYLRLTKWDTMKSSNHLSKDFPDLVLPRARDTIAGLLYVPLTVKAGQDFIVFLRKGQVREVQWAGKPYKDEKAGADASLEPRRSFKTWSETVTGRSRAWSDDQLESAGVLALIYGKFIQVWREKQSAMASNQLTAILLSNTSHAVRTPLSQIINTLELALSGDIDDDTRSMLENSHQASRALLFHVHDLLDLTRIETGNETAFNDPFDLRQTILDAVRLYQNESKRRGLDFNVKLADDLPAQVIGDARKVKTVISNLTANAVKFTDKGRIDVTCNVLKDAENKMEVIKEGHVPLEIVIADTGCGIPNEKLEAMFVTLEGADEFRSKEPLSNDNGLGLGLAVVARIVDQLSAQLRAESEVGSGSRFYFTLNMLKHDPKAPRPTSSLSSASEDKQPAVTTKVPRRTGTGSSDNASVVSLGSSANMSELDSFVQDFGSSHMFGPVPASDTRLKDAEIRMNRPGTFPVTDSSYPVRPSKVSENDADTSSTSQSPASSPPIGRSPSFPHSQSPRAHARLTRRESHGHARKSSHSHQHKPSPPSPANEAQAGRKESTASTVIVGSPSPQIPPPKQHPRANVNGVQKMRVLVVEDDMINSQILQKRLKMDKHAVMAVMNGQEAVDLLRADWDVDLVLMDIQMPIMDGRTSAKEIRKLEAKLPRNPPEGIDPLRIDGRIPIFAVSASLYESDRSTLAEHFDGWLLKPLDFNRVRALIAGLTDPAKRKAEVYVSGQWERGGYLREAPRTPSPQS